MGGGESSTEIRNIFEWWDYIMLIDFWIRIEFTFFLFQYLATPESQSLRCDLIRYICCVFHPSNELLCSDIIPRWAVIGWLLQTCTVSDFKSF